MESYKNEAFEQLSMTIDQILGTNYFIKRKWYTPKELLKFVTRDSMNGWARIVSEMEQNHVIQHSLLENVADDIWSYVKCLGVAGNEDDLKQWFCTDIPVWRYCAPCQLLRLDNGADILRALIMSIPM